MNSMSDFLAAFRRCSDFAWTKINHGFWEALGNVEHHLGWPVPADRYEEADRIARRPFFFVGGFVNELLDALANARRDGLILAFELSAWPGDNRIIGTPFHPERSLPMMERFVRYATDGSDGLLLKKAIGDGTMADLLAELTHHAIVLVGPQHISGFAEFAGVAQSCHVPIHPTEARAARVEIEDRIRDAIERFHGEAVVLLQAGTLAPYWILRMRDRYPNVRWIDAGLALSIAHTEDILSRPWGKARRTEIIRFHNSVRPERALPVRNTYRVVQDFVDGQLATSPPAPGRVAFIPSEPPDTARIEQLLEIPSRFNHWANGGPLVRILESSYHRFMSLGPGRQLAACANGGVALEALARIHEARAGRKLRWAVSAFTFKNQLRGHFAEAVVVDCKQSGMLDEAELETRLSERRVDGFVVTNIFGLHYDFTTYIDLAQRFDVPMLIDNAAGISQTVPDWPYQAFSLHHTKPYGFGEGGLAMMPADDRELFVSLLSYGTLSVEPEYWVNNGKLSDAAAAYHLDRLERHPEWAPLYEMQGIRIGHLARRAGLTPLMKSASRGVATSMPFLSPRPVTLSELVNPHLTLGKYYSPLAPLPTAEHVYQHVVNVPTHPDVAQVAEGDLMNVLSALTR